MLILGDALVQIMNSDMLRANTFTPSFYGKSSPKS